LISPFTVTLEELGPVGFHTVPALGSPIVVGWKLPDHILQVKDLIRIALKSPHERNLIAAIDQLMHDSS